MSASDRLRETARRGTVFAVATLTVMAAAAVSPAVTGIHAAFAASPAADLLARLTLTLPPLFSALGAPIAGRLIDRYGRRTPLLIALVVYAFAGGAGALAPNLLVLLSTRAALGLAVAVIMVTAVTLVTDYYDDRLRRRVLAQQSASMSFGGVLYFALGGVLVDLHWRGAFSVYLVALVLVPLVIVFLNEPDRSPLADGRSHDAYRVDRGVLGLIAAAVAGMIAFYMVPTQLPFLLKSLDARVSGTATGLAIASHTLAVAVTSLVYGRIRNHLGIRALFALLFGVMALGNLIIALADDYPSVVFGLLVFGAGIGLLFPHLSYTTSLFASPEHRGRALGLLNSGIFFGQFVSPIAVHPFILTLGLSGTFGVVAALFSGVALFCALHRSSRSPATPAPGTGPDDSPGSAHRGPH